MYINAHDAALVKASKIADKKLHSMGTDLETEIKLFIQFIASNKDYDLIRDRIPNKETIQAIEEAEAGIGLKSFSNVEDLMADLSSDDILQNKELLK